MKKLITIAALAVAILVTSAQAKTVYESNFADYVHTLSNYSNSAITLNKTLKQKGRYEYAGYIKGTLQALKDQLGLLPTKTITTASSSVSTSFQNQEILGAFLKYENILTKEELKRLKLFLMLRTSGVAAWNKWIKADITNPVTHQPFNFMSRNIIKHASFGRYLLFLEAYTVTPQEQMNATANAYYNVNLPVEFAILIGNNGSSEFLLGSEDPVFQEFVGYVVTNQYSKATKLLNNEFIETYKALPYTIATSPLKAYFQNENGKAVKMIQAQKAFKQEFLSDLL